MSNVSFFLSLLIIGLIKHYIYCDFFTHTFSFIFLNGLLVNKKRVSRIVLCFVFCSLKL